MVNSEVKILAEPFYMQKEGKMTRQEIYSDYQDYFEYHGNTVIEWTRKQRGITIRRDWIIFDSVVEAVEYFNDEVLN